MTMNQATVESHGQSGLDMRENPIWGKGCKSAYGKIVRLDKKT
jgi:hypothetical protein